MVKHSFRRSIEGHKRTWSTTMDQISRGAELVKTGGFILVQSSPETGAAEASQGMTGRSLSAVERSAIVSGVVSEIDREYSPMDDSFDETLARRAAGRAIDRAMEAINNPIEIREEQ
jgi:hypothetical protein